MNIEELKAAIDAKEREVRDVEDQLSKLRGDLISAIAAESEFKIGDRVNVIVNGKPEPGIFGGYRRKYGAIEPIVYKVKKNGSASKFEVWVYGKKIEKA